MFLALLACVEPNYVCVQGFDNADWVGEISDEILVTCTCAPDAGVSVPLGSASCSVSRGRNKCERGGIMDVDPWCADPVVIVDVVLTTEQADELRAACGPPDTGGTCDTG